MSGSNDHKGKVELISGRLLYSEYQLWPLHALTSQQSNGATHTGHFTLNIQNPPSTSTLIHVGYRDSPDVAQRKKCAFQEMNPGYQAGSEALQMPDLPLTDQYYNRYREFKFFINSVQILHLVDLF